MYINAVEKSRTARSDKNTNSCIYTFNKTVTRTHAHTHTHPFNGPLSGTTQVSRYQKEKSIWILLKQETVASAGPYASHSRHNHASTPLLSLLQAGCPSCR